MHYRAIHEHRERGIKAYPLEILKKDPPQNLGVGADIFLKEFFLNLLGKKMQFLWGEGPTWGKTKFC
jgi:hypothetical protein